LERNLGLSQRNERRTSVMNFALEGISFSCRVDLKEKPTSSWWLSALDRWRQRLAGVPREVKTWEDVENIPGFAKGMVGDLRSAGVQIGSAGG
jgi:hypothetical protein